MYRLTVVSLAFAVIAVPVSAAGLDPHVLVLRQADVPGWRLDVDNSGPRSNKREAEGDPELRALFGRAGRLGGYEAIYNRGSAEISSRADVFRQQGGARMLLGWFDNQLRKASPLPLRRTRVDLGDEGWVWVGDPIPLVGPFTLIVWRRGQILAGIAAAGVSRKRAISVARVQDRRIAAALR